MGKTTIYQVLLGVAAIAIIILTLRLLNWGPNTAPKESGATAETEKTYTGPWKKIDPKDIQDNPIRLIADDWLALAAGKEGDLNAMTIAWGGIGSLWSKPVVTVYVSTDRYTFDYMQRNDYFTVTAFPQKQKNKLAYIGSHSGRDGDKIKDAGLTVEYTELGNPTFTDGRLMIECRKIYAQQFDSALFNNEIKAIYNKGMGVHYCYIGEIVNVWTKE